MHVIVKYAGKLVEVQVRSALQHVWAEMSEKLSDIVDPGIKYGQGNPALVKLLLKASTLVTKEESEESNLANLEERASRLLALETLPEDKQREIIDLQREITDAKEKQTPVREGIFKILREGIDDLSKLR